MEIPQLGFGTFLANDPAKLKTALHYAIEDCGVRHIDTAFAYGNQNIIGSTLKEIFSKGKIKREDMFITTKLWCAHHRKDLVEKELLENLHQLQLSYVDLFLIYQPVAFKSLDIKHGTQVPMDKNGKIIYDQIDILETYHAMEECQKKGLTRYIGVSIEQLERIWFNCEIKPYANQVECNVYCQASHSSTIANPTIST